MGGPITEKYPQILRQNHKICVEYGSNIFFQIVSYMFRDLAQIILVFKQFFIVFIKLIGTFRLFYGSASKFGSEFIFLNFIEFILLNP